VFPVYTGFQVHCPIQTRARVRDEHLNDWYQEFIITSIFIMYSWWRENLSISLCAIHMCELKTSVLYCTVLWLKITGHENSCPTTYNAPSSLLVTLECRVYTNAWFTDSPSVCHTTIDPVMKKHTRNLLAVLHL